MIRVDNSLLTLSLDYVDRCRSEITDRLHQLYGVVSKHATISASLKQVSSMLDDVASNCQELSTDIGSSQEDAVALLAMSQVCITENQHCYDLLIIYLCFVGRYPGKHGIASFSQFFPPLIWEENLCR